MKYNESIATEYGSVKIGTNFSSVEPVPFRPYPSNDDYVLGIIQRVFVKRINDVRVIEISPETASGISTSLYKILYVNWRISGPRLSSIINGVCESKGVQDNNLEEISRIKIETGIDLSTMLPNPLDFWGGK